MNAAAAALFRIEDELLAVEARIGLLDACRPVEREAEERRLAALLAARQTSSVAELSPRLTVPRRPSIDAERVRLERLRLALDPFAASPTGRILCERLGELEIETEIVASRGTGRVPELAARRFYGARGASRSEADRLASEWLRESPASGSSVPAERLDLAREIRAFVAAHGLCVPVLVVDMVARAAVTDSAILVRRGALATADEARRIFVHEVYGHVLPRVRSKTLGPPFRIGPRGADGDEEGFALGLEEEHGLLKGERRRELAVRHYLAARVLDGHEIGAVLLELAERLAEREHAPDVLAAAAVRVMRGGGLCREILYLPGYLRVRRHMSDTKLRELFGCGRVTVAESETLQGMLDAYRRPA